MDTRIRVKGDVGSVRERNIQFLLSVQPSSIGSMHHQESDTHLHFSGAFKHEWHEHNHGCGGQGKGQTSHVVVAPSSGDSSVVTGQDAGGVHGFSSGLEEAFEATG